MRKIALYGGTFSPPHIGHVEAARAFYETVKPDELLIIPTATPPHKSYQAEASTDDRMEMCRLAFSSVDGARVSDMEIKRGGKSYTYLTLEELSSPDTELYFLCGTDMLLTLDGWRCFEKIFALATIVFVRRESDEDITASLAEKVNEYRALYGAKIIEIKNEVFEISSSDLRLAIKEGRAVTMLPESVLEYIETRGLYR